MGNFYLVAKRFQCRRDDLNGCLIRLGQEDMPCQERAARYIVPPVLAGFLTKETDDFLGGSL